MINSLTRIIRRIALLIPGILISYFVASDLYPVLNNRIPVAPAVLIAYIAVAYFFIPAFMRLMKIIVRPKHIPHYCITSDGFASDPVNIGIVGTRRQLIKSMSKIGWHLADKQNLVNVFRMGLSILSKTPYHNAPFSNLYLFGRKQDCGFQMPIGNSPLKRHHVRFWAAAPSLSSTERSHLEFWQQHQPNKKQNKAQLWIGSASRDTGLGLIIHNAQLTHSVHPDTDSERNFIVDSLTKANLIKKKQVVKIIDAYKLRNRVFRSHLSSDGKMTIITLKP